VRSTRDPAEQPLVNHRMSKGAGDDEIGVLRVEGGGQGLDGGQIARVGPIGDLLGLDAVRGQAIDQGPGRLAERAWPRRGAR
jgi:hypothetical protein